MKSFRGTSAFFALFMGTLARSVTITTVSVSSSALSLEKLSLTRISLSGPRVRKVYPLRDLAAGSPRVTASLVILNGSAARVQVVRLRSAEQSVPVLADLAAAVLALALLPAASMNLHRIAGRFPGSQALTVRLLLLMKLTLAGEQLGSSSSVVAELTGVAAYIATQLELPAAFAVIFSAFAAKFALKLIPFVRI